MNPLAAQVIPSVRYGGPEELFGIGSIVADGSDLTGSMPVGSWLSGPDGCVSPGALGILADDVLGFSIVAARGPGQWSVSSEITMDFLAPVRGLSGAVRGRARLMEVTPAGGFSSGELLDSEGRIIATCTQRGRFIDLVHVMTSGGEELEATPEPTASDLMTLIGAQITSTAGGAQLEFATTEGLGNPMGNLHGGISLCASQLAGISALQGSGTPFVAASIHIVYTRPIPVGSPITFSATILHRGRTSGVATVVAANPAGKPCTIATITGHLPH